MSWCTKSLRIFVNSFGSLHLKESILFSGGSCNAVVLDSFLFFLKDQSLYGILEGLIES
jgi:hypothetical protein